MAVGSVAVAGVSHACPKADTLRFRGTLAAPDTKGKKLGGGARASPPHKTLSGFDIHIHYTRSEPAVDQPGGEFRGRLSGGVHGEHGSHVVCRGGGGEPWPRLRARSPPGHAPVEEQERRHLLESRVPHARGARPLRKVPSSSAPTHAPCGCGAILSGSWLSLRLQVPAGLLPECPRYPF
jgi:hypothetical protein